MSKRAPQFKRRERDYYPTPASAVLPLVQHLPKGVKYVEPCAGDGALVHALWDNGISCMWAFDICPQAHWIDERDALKPFPLYGADLIISNVPWTRSILHPMIEHFAALRPTWLLFDAAWAHTKQAAPYLPMCQKIVSVGRVSWMQNGTSSLDDCAWYLFDANNTSGTRFFGRAA